MEQEQCRHEWEDVQLRTTKDGLLVASFDYCAKCRTLSLGTQTAIHHLRFSAAATIQPAKD